MKNPNNRSGLAWPWASPKTRSASEIAEIFPAGLELFFEIRDALLDLFSLCP
jgi:hypothetical protein